MKESFVILKDGRKLGFVDCGKPGGLAIFLFHGTPGSRIFGFENERLVQQQGLRIITPDRPGYGISDSHPNRKITDYSQDVEQLADSLGIDKFHVAGISGGGPYTLACGFALSERVLSVTLIASAVPCDMEGFFKGMSRGNKLAFFLAKYTPFLLKPLYSYAAKVLQKKPEKLLEGVKSQLCAWDQQVIESLKTRGQQDIFLAHIHEAYRQGYEGAYTDTILVSKPWGIDFQFIAAPIFVWHGECDTLMPIAPVRNFSKVLPNCECHFMEGAGHLLLESEQVSQNIIDKIKSVESELLNH